MSSALSGPQSSPVLLSTPSAAGLRHERPHRVEQRRALDLLERRPERLAVVGEHHDLVVARRDGRPPARGCRAPGRGPRASAATRAGWARRGARSRRSRRGRRRPSGRRARSASATSDVFRSRSRTLVTPRSTTYQPAREMRGRTSRTRWRRAWYSSLTHLADRTGSPHGPARTGSRRTARTPGPGPSRRRDPVRDRLITRNDVAASPENMVDDRRPAARQQARARGSAAARRARRPRGWLVTTSRPRSRSHQRNAGIGDESPCSSPAWLAGVVDGIRRPPGPRAVWLPVRDPALHRRAPARPRSPRAARAPPRRRAGRRAARPAAARRRPARARRAREPAGARAARRRRRRTSLSLAPHQPPPDGHDDRREHQHATAPTRASPRRCRARRRSATHATAHLRRAGPTTRAPAAPAAPASSRSGARSSEVADRHHDGGQDARPTGCGARRRRRPRSPCRARARSWRGDSTRLADVAPGAARQARRARRRRDRRSSVRRSPGPRRGRAARRRPPSARRRGSPSSSHSACQTVRGSTPSSSACTAVRLVEPAAGPTRACSSRPWALPSTSSTSCQNSRSLTGTACHPAGARACRWWPTEWPRGARPLLRPRPVRGSPARSTQPTAAQLGAWEAVAGGDHALVVAPTGSGKTLAAFLWALDGLLTGAGPQDPLERCRVLYVSPLKALATDVERNLRSPLVGIRQAATRLGIEPARRDGRHPHRGHAARGAPGVRDAPAGHPHHDPRVAVPRADVRRPGRAGRRPHGHRRRDPRGRRRPSAARTSRCRSSASTPCSTGRAARARRSGSACRRPSARSTPSPSSSAARARTPEGGRLRGRRAAAVGQEDRGRRRRARAGPDRPARATPADAELDLTGAAAGELPPPLHLAARRGAGGRPGRRAPLDARVHQLAARGRAADRADQRGVGRAAGRRRPRPGHVPRGAVPGAVGHGRGRRHPRRRDDPGARAPRVDEPRGAHPHGVRAQGRPAAGRRRHQLPRARHRHGRDRPGRPGGRAAVGRERAAAHRARGPPGRRGVPRRRVPDVPRRAGARGGHRAAHAHGALEALRRPAQPARRARAADRRDGRGRGLDGRRARDRRAPRAPLLAPGRRHAARGARHARGPLPERGLRRAAPAAGLGPGRATCSAGAPARCASP